MSRSYRAEDLRGISIVRYFIIFILTMLVSNGVNAIVPPPLVDVFFQFSTDNYTVNETDGNATISVTVSGCTLDTNVGLLPGDTCQVGYATTGDGSATPGADFTPVSGTLTFTPSGSATQTFTVPILDDALVEDNETVGLALNNPVIVTLGEFNQPTTEAAQLGAIPTATLTIVSDDLPLTANPTALSFSGVPGQMVEGTVAISGGVPPYAASSSVGATTQITNGTLSYTYTIPADATADISDNVTVTDEMGTSITIPVNITVGQGLTASPTALDLSGAAGDSVGDTVSISGGAPPYQASSALGATTSISNGSLTYSYPIPSNASGTLTDTVTVVDSLGATLEIPVRIDVSQPLSVSPESLNLEGTPVGDTANSSFIVSGGTPPYRIEVTSGPGSVTPTTLTSPGGEVTYSVTIPDDTPPGTQLDALITITDSAALAKVSQLPVVIGVVGNNPLSSRTDLSPNQRSVAVALETFCPELARMDPTSMTPGQRDLLNQCTELLSNADSSGIPNALSQITTEKARASTSTSIEVATQQLANVGSRLAALRRGSTGIDVSGVTLNIDGRPLSGSQISSFLSAGDTGGGASGDSESAFGNWGFFINGNFNFGDKDDTLNEAGFDFDTKGITAGADYRLSDKLILGGALGYANNEVDFSSAGGDLDSDSWSLSAYGTYYVSDQIYIDGILGYGWNDFQSKRNIIYQVSESSVNRTARSDYDGSQFGGSLGAGYIFNREALEFGVYGRLNYLKVDVDGFRETQASGLDLRVRGFDATSLTTSVGGRISRSYSTQKAVLVPQASFEWEHEFDNDATNLVAQFVNDPTNTAFEIFTDSPDRDYFRLGLGVTAVFPGGMTAFANYDTVLAKDDWTDHAIDVGVRWEF